MKNIFIILGLAGLFAVMSYVITNVIVSSQQESRTEHLDESAGLIQITNRNIDLIENSKERMKKSGIAAGIGGGVGLVLGLTIVTIRDKRASAVSAQGPDETELPTTS